MKLNLYLLLLCAGIFFPPFVEGNVGSHVLKLSVRRDADLRSIDIELSTKSLLLFIWIAVMIILLYEIFLTFCYRINHSCNCKIKKEGAILPVAEESSDPDNAKKRQQHQHQRWASQFHYIILILWFISTCYGVFYSFEMCFLYWNDSFHSLLVVQLFMTITDTITWMTMIATVKYRLLPLNHTLGYLSCGIKIIHIIFNVFGENGWNMARHWLFLLEDSTYLLLAPDLLGVHLKVFIQRKGIATIVVAMVSAPFILRSIPGQRVT